MVAGGSDILRTPRPGEHKRRTIYERRISRCYARPRSTSHDSETRQGPSPGRPARPEPHERGALPERVGRAPLSLNRSAGPAGWVLCLVRGGVQGTRRRAVERLGRRGLEVGGGADAEAGGLRVAEAGRGQRLGG